MRLVKMLGNIPSQVLFPSSLLSQVASSVASRRRGASLGLDKGNINGWIMAHNPRPPPPPPPRDVVDFTDYLTAHPLNPSCSPVWMRRCVVLYFSVAAASQSPGHMALLSASIHVTPGSRGLPSKYPGALVARDRPNMIDKASNEHKPPHLAHINRVVEHDSGLVLPIREGGGWLPVCNPGMGTASTVVLHV